MTLDDPATPPDATIFTVLAGRARMASDGRLVAYAGAGILGIGLVLLIRPALWVLMLPCAAFSAFGIWGIADRVVSERAGGAPEHPVGLSVLRGVKRVAVVIGTLAGIGTFLVGVGLVVGSWTL